MRSRAHFPCAFEVKDSETVQNSAVETVATRSLLCRSVEGVITIQWIVPFLHDPKYLTPLYQQ